MFKILLHWIQKWRLWLPHLYHLPSFHQVAEQDGQRHYGHAGQDAATNDLVKIMMIMMIMMIILRDNYDLVGHNAHESQHAAFNDLVKIMIMTIITILIIRKM